MGLKRILYTMAILMLGIWVIFPGCISGSRPIWAKSEGHWVLPVFSEKKMEYEHVYIRPLFPYDPGTIDLKNSGFQAPQIGANRISDHYLGSDELGRDTLAALVHGFSASFKIGLGAALLALILGIIPALWSGYYYSEKRESNGLLLLLKFLLAIAALWFVYYGTVIGSARLVIGVGFIYLCLLLFLRWVRLRKVIPGMSIHYDPDMWTLRLADAYEWMPKLIVLFVFVAYFKWNAITLTLIMGLLSWPYVYRQLRMQVIRIKSLPYIEVARLQGIPLWRQMFYYILPELWPYVASIFPFIFIAAVVSESSLSFVGLGLGPEDISLGKMIAEGRNFPSAWWLWYSPVFLLSATLFVMSVLGYRWSKKWQRQK